MPPQSKTIDFLFRARVLNEYLRGVSYDVTSDKYLPTSGREMAPMFEAIFEDAPAGYEATRDYLKDWAEILWQVYPDYVPDGSKNQYGAHVAVNQPYIMQMALAALENLGLDVDLPAMMDALGVNEEYLRTTVSVYNDISKVMGTKAEDYFYLTSGGANVLSIANDNHFQKATAA